MLKTIKAVIDSEGNVHLQEPVNLVGERHALVTILEDESLSSIPETTLLSEPTLAVDWNRPEEDAAWSHLQQAQ
jgi:hypothetical protein